MASTGKKAKKKKKTTISIVGPPVFTNAALSTDSWADQSEIELIESIRNVNTDINLPKAPRSTRECEFDDSQVPTSPPYQAHLTNIPFDITEDEIIDHFGKFTIINCTLPKDGRNSSRLKGYGYIEFELREELISALCIGEMNVKGRRMKIDLPGNKDGRPDFRDRGGRDMGHRQGSRMGDGDPEDPERTESDWRNAPRPAMPEREGFRRDGFRSDDRDRDRDRDRGFSKRPGFDRDEKPKEIDNDAAWREGDRAPPPAREPLGERSNGWREPRDRSGGGGFERRDRDRDGGRDRDRNGFERIRQERERERERDGSKNRERDGSLDWRADMGGERESRAFDRRDRDSGFGRRDRDRDGFDRRGRDGFRDRDRDRDGGRDRDRDGGRDRDRDGGRDRDGFGRRDRDDGFGRRDRDMGFERKGDPDQSEKGWRDEPRVIPTPRPNTRDITPTPKDRDSAPAPTNKDGSREGSPIREKKEEAPATRKRLNLQPRTAPISNTAEVVPSSVFGNAKPVDTAAKERELEEKWKSRGRPEPKEGDKERSDKGTDRERSDRERGDRDRDRGDRDRDRGDRDRDRGDRDRDRSDRDRRRPFNRDRDHHKDRDSENRPSKENEPPKEEKSFEPAPPPKENAWTKRPQLAVNNGLPESEESKEVKKVESEPKEQKEEVVLETKPKDRPTESAPKETSKPKENISSDAKTNSQTVTESKKSDATVNNRAPPKASEPVKPSKVQPQERQEPQEPLSGDGDDSEWSTKVSRIESSEEIQSSKMLKAKEQKPPNFATVNKYALFDEDPEDIIKPN